MDKQLNFLNIFDEEGHKKDAIDEVEGAGVLNMDADIDEKNVLENDPSAFDEFEQSQKEEANRLTQESERLAGQKKLEMFLLDFKDRQSSLSLSDFDPFLIDLDNYDKRFQSFREQLQVAKPGLEKETIYRKIVSPHIEDEPEFRTIAALYLIYLEKLKEFRAQTKQPSSEVDQRIKTPKKKRNTFWGSSKLDQGKDAAAGAYLDYKDE
jgi:hypothetical protein